MSEPKVDAAHHSVELDGTTYRIQELGPDNLAVLVAGVPVGRIVFSWGVANGVAEGDTVSEDTLTAIAEAWFAAADAG
ncbi:MAG TPA: hypothetical protein PLU22_05530 [Polyangiaceae bacterium]|nr:hypothetical protein [Polyangiaceae bacterium]